MSALVCKNCGSGKVVDYFHLRNSPLLHNVLNNRQEDALKAERIDCDFILCSDCGFLFNGDYREVVYDDSYDNDQSHSSVYNSHLMEVSAYIQSYLSLESSIMEVGCGNGAVLANLAKAGFLNVLGFDPAHPSDTKYIQKNYWRKDGRQYDCIILRHILEGIDDFNGFLSDICESVKYTGFVYLELTNARVLVENSSTTNLYHEYRQYFCEYSSAYALRRNGFYVHYIRHFMGGEILGLIAMRVRQSLPISPKLEILKKYKNMFIWGISGRSIHFLTHYSLGCDIIRYGVDIDPHKQGMYIPVTGQEIISPRECMELHPDCIILLNANYLEEVRGLFQYQVDILTRTDLYHD